MLILLETLYRKCCFDITKFKTVETTVKISYSSALVNPVQCVASVLQNRRNKPKQKQHPKTNKQNEEEHKNKQKHLLCYVQS